MRNKVCLPEISIIRLILILCIVIGHSFAPFSGGSWHSICEGEIAIYMWINPFFISFQLGAFVLISGYLYKHTSLSSVGWRSFVWKKFERLMIPGILFSLIYLYLFADKPIGIGKFIVNILSGAGHLWFLPMLFWCFIFTFFIGKLNCSKRSVIIFLCILALLPLPVPLGIGNAFHYLIYFYLGIVLYDRRSDILVLKKSCIIILWIIYLLTIFIEIIGRNYLMSFIDFYGVYSKAAVLATINTIQLLVTVSGSLALYSTILKVIHGINVTNNFILFCGKSFYGIYIFHQFILVYLYYHTSLSSHISIYLMPWLGLVVSLAMSLICTYGMLKTKIGRFLIG